MRLKRIEWAMTRNLLIFVVAAIVGVAHHIHRRPVTEVLYNVPDVRTKDGEIRMRHPPIVESYKIHQHLTVILGVIPHMYEIGTSAWLFDLNLNLKTLDLKFDDKGKKLGCTSFWTAFNNLFNAFHSFITLKTLYITLFLKNKFKISFSNISIHKVCNIMCDITAT